MKELVGVGSFHEISWRKVVQGTGRSFKNQKGGKENGCDMEFKFKRS